MTYHTVLKTSSDFINAMTSARRIAANITAMLNKERDGRCPIEVFPYRSLCNPYHPSVKN